MDCPGLDNRYKSHPAVFFSTISWHGTMFWVHSRLLISLMAFIVLKYLLVSGRAVSDFVLRLYLASLQINTLLSSPVLVCSSKHIPAAS